MIRVALIGRQLTLLICEIDSCRCSSFLTASMKPGENVILFLRIPNFKTYNEFNRQNSRMALSKSCEFYLQLFSQFSALKGNIIKNYMKHCHSRS